MNITKANPSQLRKTIETTSRKISADLGRPVRIMEVCGTHTVSLRRHGIHSILPDSIRMISGPGCPVCVTPISYVDNAINLIEQHDVAIATFGDMVRVPGSDGRSLSLFRSEVDIVYSPSQLIDIAESRTKPVIFLGIGFETTIPTVLRAIADSAKRNMGNLYFYTSFRLVQPALEALLAENDHGIDGFLLPGHVSIVLGADGYAFLSPFGVPGAITGFEPVEILTGINSLLGSVASASGSITNDYAYVVRPEGNPRALKLMDDMLEPADAIWRGLGTISLSSLVLNDEYRHFDAADRFGLEEHEAADVGGCKCGEVISGKTLPPECRHFGSRCTPENPVGPCMVSSEGTCSAYLRYVAP